MTRSYIFGKCLLGWCSFQCDCCFTMSECHVCTMNNIPSYTMSVWHVAECRCIQIRCTPPAHQTECYRVALHHVSLICGRMQYVPRSDVTLHPGNQIQSYRVLLHHVSLTCGRMPVYPGQIYIPCKLYPVLQSWTTACQFDMLLNADVHRSDVTPHNPC